jgi:phage-related protein (TIGR01555 family)
MSDTPVLAGLDSAMRADSWENCFTGLGTTRDKMYYTTYLPNVPLTDKECEFLYYGSDIAAKVVDFRPKEMFRQSYELKVDGDDGAKDDRLKDLLKKGKEIKLDHNVMWSLIWANLWGGCLLYMGVNDGGTVDQPLNKEKVSKFTHLHAIDKRYATALSWYTSPEDVNYGKPETYRIGNPLYGGSVVIHESRCLKFDGIYVDPVKRRETAGWGLSVLQRVYEALRDFSTGFQAVGNMLTDASQGVFKLKGLIAAIASKNKEYIQARMATVDMSRSSARSLMLDADGGEDFTKIATQFAGVDAILDRYMQRLSAACGIPVAILMGRSVAGLNATGDADFRAWYDTVATEQKNVLEPVLVELYQMIARAEGMGEIEDLCVSFNPLWQPTEQEQAQTYSAVASADKTYIDAGVLHASEVAISRFGQAKFSLATKIDVDSREQELEKDIEFALSDEENQAAKESQEAGFSQPIEGAEVPGKPVSDIPVVSDGGSTPEPGPE